MSVYSRSIGWLDGNRNRAYPVESSEWAKSVGASSPLSCVLLDATVFDASAGAEGRKLTIERCDVRQDETEVSMSYGGVAFPVRLTPTGAFGYGVRLSWRRGADHPVYPGQPVPMGCSSDSFEYVKFQLLHKEFSVPVCCSLTFSSHEHILGTVGVGSFEIGAPIMKCRVVCAEGTVGVRRIYANGTAGDYYGYESGLGPDGNPAYEPYGGGAIAGDIVLEDGFGTMPVVKDGRVVVRVGNSYGKRRCGRDKAAGMTSECDTKMLFFCGQNVEGVDSGDVVLKGGSGISVASGGRYSIGPRKSKDSIPCVEIVAGPELMDMYRPE